MYQQESLHRIILQSLIQNRGKPKSASLRFKMVCHGNSGRFIEGWIYLPDKSEFEGVKINMAKIIWEGNQPWGKEFPDIPLPEGAVKIKRPDNLLSASVPYGIIPMILCFIAVIIKKSTSTESFSLICALCRSGFLSAFY